MLKSILLSQANHLHLPIFFFQAEDGIRELYVTGVQTCALPISARPAYRRSDRFTTTSGTQPVGSLRALDVEGRERKRSEERRVGKSVDLGGRRIYNIKNCCTHIVTNVQNISNFVIVSVTDKYVI